MSRTSRIDGRQHVISVRDLAVRWRTTYNFGQGPRVSMEEAFRDNGIIFILCLNTIVIACSVSPSDIASFSSNVLIFTFIVFPSGTTRLDGTPSGISFLDGESLPKALHNFCHKLPNAHIFIYVVSGRDLASRRSFSGRDLASRRRIFLTTTVNFCQDSPSADVFI